MPEVNWGNYGVAGLAMAVLVITIFKLPDIVMAFKSNKGGEDKDKAKQQSDNEFKALLENNTMAIVELTQFLKTQAEVDKEKEKQSNKVLDSIEAKVNKLIELQTEHMAKCETKCIH